VGAPLKVVRCGYNPYGNYVCYLEGLVCPSTYSASYTEFRFNLPSGLDYDNAGVGLTFTTYLDQGSCDRQFNMSIGFGVNYKCAYDLKAPYVPGQRTTISYVFPPGSLAGCFREGENVVNFYSPALGALCFPWAVICAKVQVEVTVPPPGAPSPSPSPPSPSPSPSPSPPPSAPPPPPPPPSPSPVNWWLIYALVLLAAIAIGAAVGVTASSR